MSETNISCEICDITSNDAYIRDKWDVVDFPDGYDYLCEACYDDMGGI